MYAGGVALRELVYIPEIRNFDEDKVMFSCAIFLLKFSFYLSPLYYPANIHIHIQQGFQFSVLIAHEDDVYEVLSKCSYTRIHFCGHRSAV